MAHICPSTTCPSTAARVTCAVRDWEFYANLLPFAGGGGDLPSDNAEPTHTHPRA